MKLCLRVGFFLSLLMVHLTAQAGLISLSLDSRTNTSLAISMNGSGFETGLTSGSFNLDFDSSVLSFASGSFNQDLFGPDQITDLGTIDNAAGTLRGGEFINVFGLDAATTLPLFNIATFVFDFVGLPTTSIDLGIGSNTLGTINFFDLDGPEVIFDVDFAGLEINIPEPAPLVLLGIGLIGFCVCRRTSNKSVA